MAEVTGYLGDQPIELNNAATETTMKELVAAIALMSTRLGTEKQSQAKVNRELDKFYKQLGKSTERMTKLNDEVDDAVALEKKANAARKDTIDSLKKYTGKVELAVNKLATIMNSFASMGSSISSAVGMMSNVNKNLGVVFSGVAASTERLMTVFRESSSVGANFNGSIRDMANTISGTGMTFEEFSSVISKNSQSLAMFGGTTQEGARRLAQMSKTLKNDIPKLSDDLARLGFSTTDIADNMAWYGSLIQRTGGAQNMSTKQLIQSSAEYMKNLDIISRITGQSKQDLMAQREAEKSDAAFRMLEQKAGGTAENARMLLQLLPASYREAGKTLMARKAPVTPESQALMLQFPDLSQKLINLGVQIDKTGQISYDDAIQTYKLGLEESQYRKQQQQDFNEAAQYQDKYNDTIVGSIEFQQRSKDGVERAIQEQLKSLKQQSSAGVDAAKTQRLQQDIADKSNDATLVQAEQIDKLITAYKTISDQLPIVSSLYQKMMDNIFLVIGGLMAFNAALWAASNLPGGMGGGGGGRSRGRGGRGGWAGKVPRNIKGGLVGLGTGLVLDQAAEMATSSGHEQLGAGIDIAGSTASWAATGFMVGGPWGALAGGILGAGLGIWSNWGTITKKETAVKKENVKLQQDINSQLESVNKDRVAAERARDVNLNDPIALLLNEIKTVAPRVFEAFLRGNANGGVAGAPTPSAANPSAATPAGMTQIKTANGVTALVDSRYAPRFQGLINDIESTGYRIKKLVGYEDRPGGVKAYNPKSGKFDIPTGRASHHTTGTAIDIDPSDNKNLKNQVVSKLPPQTGAFAKKWGVGWGANWATQKDAMHFDVNPVSGGRGLDWAPQSQINPLYKPASAVPSNPWGPRSNLSLGRTELDHIANERDKKTDMQKLLDKSHKGYNQEPSQKLAETGNNGVNNNDVVQQLRETNRLISEQNGIIKKNGWMVGPQH